MKVRAVMQGFYQGKLRQAGEEFDLVPIPGKNKKTGKPGLISAEDQFSHVWMMVIDGSPVPPPRRNVGWDQSMDASAFGTLDGKRLEDMSKEELVTAITNARAFFNMKPPVEAAPEPVSVIEPAEPATAPEPQNEEEVI